MLFFRQLSRKVTTVHHHWMLWRWILANPQQVFKNFRVQKSEPFCAVHSPSLPKCWFHVNVPHFFLFGESSGFIPSTSTENENNIRWHKCGVIRSTLGEAPCFFSKAKQASWDKTVSLEVAIWVSGRVIRVLILTPINDKKSFQTISPFMTGSISFYFLHNNTICVFYIYIYICKYSR